MTSRVHWRGRRSWVLHGAIASLAALCLFLLAWRFDWFTEVEEKLYDLGLNLMTPPSGDAECLIIAVDSVSLTRWPEPAFPISRHLTTHARLVRALDSAGAKLICFDVLFDRLDSASNADMCFFADACNSAGTVLLASSLEDTRVQPDLPLTATRLISPPEVLSKSVAGVGLVDVPLDADGEIRRATIGVEFQDTLRLSFAAQASQLAGRPAAVGAVKAGTFLIDYSWLPRIPVISYHEAFERADLQRSVSGKIVIIGATVEGSNDHFPIPLNGSDGRPQRTPGVVIQAVATQTLLAHGYLRAASTTANLLILVLLGVPLIVLATGGRAWMSIVMYPVLAGGLVVASVLAIPYAHLVLPAGKWLLSLASLLAVQWILSISFLRKETTSQQMVIADYTADMQSAQIIQQHLQPRAAPTDARLDIAVRQLTNKEVGGDYYDFMEFGDGKVGFLIGDVAGKGVSASLIMSNVQAIFRTEAPQHDSPSAVLHAINSHLNSVSSASGRFISLFYGILDSITGRLLYSNGGHCNPMIYGENGNLYELTEGGPFLGPFPDLRYTDSEAQLCHGDLLCLYTDGVSEAYRDDISEQFGEARICHCLRQTSGTAQDILDHLLKTCQAFVRKQPFQDDWTAVIVRLLSCPT